MLFYNNFLICVGAAREQLYVQTTGLSLYHDKEHDFVYVLFGAPVGLFNSKLDINLLIV